jgi:hypothetical protein
MPRVEVVVPSSFKTVQWFGAKPEPGALRCRITRDIRRPTGVPEAQWNKGLAFADTGAEIIVVENSVGRVIGTKVRLQPPFNGANVGRLRPAITHEDHSEAAGKGPAPDPGAVEVSVEEAPTWIAAARAILCADGLGDDACDFISGLFQRLTRAPARLTGREVKRFMLLARRYPLEAAPFYLDEWDAGLDHDPIPPRGWLLGGFVCRGFLTVLLGDGGVGKTSFIIACALSLVTQVSYVDEYVNQRSRVLLVCFEDGKDELRRRVRAAQLYYNIKHSEIVSRLFLATVNNPAAKLASCDAKTRELVRGALADELERVIVSRKVDVVILDPFVKTHAVHENDNVAVDFVAGILAEIGIKLDIAPVTLQHVRKGGDRPGDAAASRGASSLPDAGRLVYTMTKMSDKEAEALGVNDVEARCISRFDDAKVNLVQGQQTKWYRTVGQKLGNSSDRYPLGDEIGVTVRWKPTSIMTGMTPEIINKILATIDQAAEGARYSAHQRAKRKAWPIVGIHLPDCTEERAKAIIKK